MTLILLAYLGGVLTIVSPCILPVLPFVFARGERPFLTGTLPLLAGMAVMFAAVASLAAVGGGWAVSANQYGRIAAMVLLTLVRPSRLLSRSLADRLTRPLVALGDRLSGEAGARTGIGSSFLLGIATGLLWAPCAGPILGLVLTGAAIGGASVRHDPAAAGLRRGCGHIAGAGASGRRANLRGDEAILGRGRMGAPRVGRGRCWPASSPSPSVSIPVSWRACRWPTPRASSRD